MRTMAFLAAAALLAGCASARVPAEVAGCGAQVPAEGMVEMEVDASGAMYEIEWGVGEADVPREVLAAVEAVAPGGSVTGYEKEWMDGTLGYEVKKRVEGREMEIVVSAKDFRVLVKEIEIDDDEAPAAVRSAAESAAAGGKITSWERIEQKGGATFHVKFRSGDFRYKAIFSPEGRLLRKAREVTAEIEVPVP